jgi:hypothetical protein
MTSADVRQRLIDALELDLVGPPPSDQAHQMEILLQTPSKWYLTGFLVPAKVPHIERLDENEDEIIDEVRPIGTGDDENPPEDGASSKRGVFPSSMGLSVLVSAQTNQLDITAYWGDYVFCKKENTDTIADSPKYLHTWQRIPSVANLCVDLIGDNQPHHVEIPDSRGLQLVILERKISDELSVPKGTRSVSVFLVNQRKPVKSKSGDEDCVFQTRLVLRSMESFIARPDVRQNDDWDEQVADLQYCNDFEYAVGHNVSSVAIRQDGDTACYEVRTAWLPTAEVEKVIPATCEGAELSMEALAQATSAEDIRKMLDPLHQGYAKWIENNRHFEPKDSRRQQVARDLLQRAEIAKERIISGLALLDKPEVREAFCLANGAMARAARQRSAQSREDRDPAQVPTPTWRPFQIAFILMNLNGVEDPTHQERDLVDLLFFPTGGGKTEAYLGLAAFTLLLRRLRHPSVQSAGVSVLMRYTLRLLTLDQLSRAAILICALELERQKDPAKLGDWPFEIGLWVGQGATPNRMGQKGDNDDYSARSQTMAYIRNDSINPAPIPLENCPWCGEKFNKNSFQLLPNSDLPTDLRVICINRKCTYGIPGQYQIKKLPLPILSVDEPIYRRLPCFMIATVDKFANLPWVGETGKLFGKVEYYDREGFYGPSELGKGEKLQYQLLPPDLIIQDELHLISGPLGTLVGLYETAIDALASREIDDQICGPKIIASTATVRRASRQIRALFGRSKVDIFPPPGPNRRDSFFAQTVLPKIQNARTYLGVAAPGRNAKVVLLRSYLTLLSAAQKLWQEAGGSKNPDNPADPYMTLLGYFGSLRELGGSRRIVEDEVNSRLSLYSKRHRYNERDGDSVFANRKIDDEPLELTSRVTTNKVAEAKRRLALRFSEKDRVDVALATNMISVGLDITRLGLMVVLGQPKTTAEYIQATSRVGRDAQRPGLIVTLLNTYRPRDRSHYERFQAWHATFYRGVEATSVTPFSPRAIDRGIAAITVALSRLGHSPLTAPQKAIDILTHRSALDFVVETISRRAENHDKDLDANEADVLRQKLRTRVQDLLDTWYKIALEKKEANAGLQYQKEVGTYPPLLFQPLDPALANQPLYARKFKAPRSLRDIEPNVNLWAKNPDGFVIEEDAT